MLELLWTILIFFVGLFFIPIVAYLTARMGSYGWLKGKWLFQQDHPRFSKKGKVNGEQA